MQCIRIGFILLFFTTCLHLQHVAQPSVRFERISSLQGLSQNAVSSVLQDSEGFMWFGTLDGLNRYDGYHINVYRNNPNKEYSLADNYINTIFEDPNGQLWIGTRSEGIAIYNKLTDKFQTIKHDVFLNQSLSDNNILHIYQDFTGYYWICTANGINKLVRENTSLQEIEESVISNEINAELNHFNHYLYEKNQTKKLKPVAHELLQTPDGRFWLATDMGFMRFNPEKDTSYYTPGDVLKIPANTIELTGKIIWVGTTQGLAAYNTDMGKLEYLNSFPQIPITAIQPDNKGNLWIGTNEGLFLYNMAKGNYYQYTHTPADDASLSSNTVETIYIDKTGILWVGTYLGGVNKWDQYSGGIELHRNNPYNKNSLPSNQIRTVFQDSQGVFWIGTVDKGLCRWNQKTNIFTQYEHNPRNPQSLPHNHVRVVYEDKNKNIWVGTDGGGLAILNPKTGSFYTYKNIPGKENSLSNNNVWDILEDSEGNIWIGTHGGGLNLFQPETRTFKVYAKKAGRQGSLSDDKITTIFQDSKNNLWIGTFGGGLERWNPRTQMFEHYRHSKKNPRSICSNRIYSIHEDTKGRIWVGTKGGLNLLTENGIDFIRFTQDIGLPNDVIMGILEDSKENLWLSTNYGIAKLNPQTKEIRAFDTYNGLQSMEFLVGSYFEAEDGKMYFGGINGLNSFYPDSIHDNPFKPQIVITSFKLFNQNIEPGENSVLKEHISKTTEIQLKYNQNFISFDFAALHFSNPLKNSYSYKLENFDANWNHCGADRRFATYTNLDPGTYTFRVIGTNSDGVKNDEGVFIKIIVHPPIWREYWFQIPVVLLFIFLIIGSVRYRIKTIQRQKELLEILVKERTATVEAQKQEIIKQSEELAKLSIVASETDSAVLIMDKTGYIEWVNDGFVRMFGYTLTQWRIAKGESIMSNSPSENIISEILELCILSRQPVQYDIPVKRKDGRELWVHVNLTPILDEKQNIIKLVAIDTDISQIKEAEKEILKQKQEIEAQRDDIAGKSHEIHIQNENIKGSIRYALTIQQAILPLEKDIKTYFPNFVIFKPKDIVSGDFYFFTKSGNSFFAAVVDCTGHGVPGAFMSMIGSSLLNEIISIKHILDPKLILETLNESISKALKQTETENNDGMDVCLVRLDKITATNTTLITYAGAKRPLFIADPNLPEIQTLKGSRKSIGGIRGQSTSFDFMNEEYTAPPNSVIYLSSDGLIDQNDVNRKKFGSTRFVEILQQISNLDIVEQHQVLTQTIQVHMENTEQRDDITVFGLKLNS